MTVEALSIACKLGAIVSTLVGWVILSASVEGGRPRFSAALSAVAMGT